MPEVTRKRINKQLSSSSKIQHVFKIRYLIGRNHDAIRKLQSSYKIHLNISNGKLSDPLCDNEKRSDFSQIGTPHFC